MIKRTRIPIFTVTLSLLYYGVSISHIQHASSSVQSYDIGDVVDNFTLPSARGNSISLYDYWGDVILIHVWHSG
jgi:cytochrome oxidase Cu insertion factor (SCO1/SenC/PrrC family)